MTKQLKVLIFRAYNSTGALVGVEGVRTSHKYVRALMGENFTFPHKGDNIKMVVTAHTKEEAALLRRRLIKEHEVKYPGMFHDKIMGLVLGVK